MIVWKKIRAIVAKMESFAVEVLAVCRDSFWHLSGLCGGLDCIKPLDTDIIMQCQKSFEDWISVIIDA